jgi:peroxiredoxin
MVYFMMKHLVPFLLLLAVLAPSLGHGGLIGDPAPPLVIKEWIRGQPVAVESGTNITVVEIWNAAIPACRTVITNLNHLQKRFQTNGVVIVGVSDEPIEKLREFVLHDGGTNIQYHIAADEHRKTSISYMKPAQQMGVPYVFVVGTNGLLLWHGHPQGGLEQTLEQMIAGQFDLEHSKNAQIASHQMAQYLNLMRRPDFRAKLAGQVLLANRTNDVPLLCDLAFQIATAPGLAKRDFALANEALNQAEQVAPTNTATVMITRAVWLFESGKPDAGLILAKQALASAPNPRVKTDIQLLLHTMETHLAAAKTNQSNAGLSNTNSQGNANSNQIQARPMSAPLLPDAHPTNAPAGRLDPAGRDSVKP